MAEADAGVGRDVVATVGIDPGTEADTTREAETGAPSEIAIGTSAEIEAGIGGRCRR